MHDISVCFLTRWDDISRGYFGDFHGKTLLLPCRFSLSKCGGFSAAEFRKTGGKRFEAADQLCSRKVCLLK